MKKKVKKIYRLKVYAICKRFIDKSTLYLDLLIYLNVMQ